MVETLSKFVELDSILNCIDTNSLDLILIEKSRYPFFEIDGSKIILEGGYYTRYIMPNGIYHNEEGQLTIEYGRLKDVQNIYNKCD